MKLWMIGLALLVWFVIWFSIFASNHRIVAVIPYCFDRTEFVPLGTFRPCSEVFLTYDA